MQCTPRLCGPPGFWARSLEVFQRQAGIALRFEAVTGPQRVYTLVDFEKPSSVDVVKAMSDGDVGGFSTAQVERIEKTDLDLAHLRFTGKISSDLPNKRSDVDRMGFSGWRTTDRGATIFGTSMWNIDDYSWLALRIKADGRKYFVNIQTDSIVPTDLHQHRLYVRKPHEWETVLLPLNGFVRTNGGRRVNPQSEMIKERVRSVGISIMDGALEPFDLRVHSIWATNWPEESTRSQLAAAAMGRSQEEIQDGSIRHTAPEGPERIFR